MKIQYPGFLGVGVQDKSVVVFLSEGHHHTAASLKDRYGSQVQVTWWDMPSDGVSIFNLVGFCSSASRLCSFPRPVS